ncbi:MAG: hypothetical protein HGB12_02970 [Bacteroidetes bacterium]|nr:hypothetical protein [Bacteroidota bacterium]
MSNARNLRDKMKTCEYCKHCPDEASFEFYCPVKKYVKRMMDRACNSYDEYIAGWEEK